MRQNWQNPTQDPAITDDRGAHRSPNLTELPRSLSARSGTLNMDTMAKLAQRHPDDLVTLRPVVQERISSSVERRRRTSQHADLHETSEGYDHPKRPKTESQCELSSSGSHRQTETAHSEEQHNSSVIVERMMRCSIDELDDGKNRDAPSTTTTANPPRRGLTSLPPEILLNLLKALPTSNSFSFALTCRYAYLVVGREPLEDLKRLKNKDSYHHRAQFLLNWERDLPDRLTCITCLCHHKWRTIGQKHPLTDLEMQRAMKSRQCHDGGHRVYKHFTISTAMVRLVLRAHALSPQHGLPVSALSHHCSTKDGRTWMDSEVEGKSVNGRLLVRETCRLSLGLVDGDKDWLHGIKNRLYMIPHFCIHQNQWGGLDSLCSCAISHLSTDETHRGQFLKTVHRCEEETEYSSRIVRCKLVASSQRFQEDVWSMNLVLVAANTMVILSSGYCEPVHNPWRRPKLMESQHRESKLRGLQILAQAKKEDTVPKFLCSRNPQDRWDGEMEVSNPPADGLECLLCRQKKAEDKCLACKQAEKKEKAEQVPFCGRCVDTRRCLYCPTEFQVKVRRTQFGEAVLEVVAYKDYGSDSHPCAPEITSHSTAWSARVSEQYDPTQPYIYRFGSIHRLFEYGMDQIRLLPILQDASLTPLTTRCL